MNLRFVPKNLKRMGLRNLSILNRNIKSLNPIARDPFGNFIAVKRALISVLAAATYGRFNIVNSLKVQGTEHLKNLPATNVIFMSNHQTYYADVMALYHIFCSIKWNIHNTIDIPVYTLYPRAKTFYVAAEETMHDSGLIPKIFSYTGAVTVRRAWRQKGKDIKGSADVKAPEKIAKALEAGWVIHFPQGTTSPYAPIRKGTASLLKAYNPIVIPVVIDGFRRAFDKKGLRFKKRGTTLSVRFKEPLQYSPDEPAEQLLEKIRLAIEQVPDPALE